MSASYIQALTAACLCSGLFSVFSSEKNEGTDRFLRFVLTLCLIAALLLPLKDLSLSLSNIKGIFSQEPTADASAASSASVYRFESGIKQMLADKFGIGRNEVTVSVTVEDGAVKKAEVSFSGRNSVWLAKDAETYLNDRLDCEVKVYAYG